MSATASTLTLTAPAPALPSQLAAPSPLLAWASAAGGEPFTAGLPPWSRFAPGDFTPAITAACASHLDEARAIVANDAAPTFANTIAPLDRAGAVLDAVSRALSFLCSSATSPALQAVELETAPILAAHSSRVYMLPGLFSRVDAVHAARATLGPEEMRLTERLHLDFVRAGARFDTYAQTRYAAIMEELASLTTRFSQNVLGDEEGFTITLTRGDLEGCPDDLIASARQAAVERKVEGDDAHIITLSRSLVEPFLTHSPRRDLRERAWRAWTRRGELCPQRDNARVVGDILRLRAEQAVLHGHVSFGAYQTADTMARSPARVMELLETVWPKAVRSAERERVALEAEAASLEGGSPTVAPWDWRFLAERVRRARFDFDDSVLKPYLSLDAMTEAIFTCAHELFGLLFVKRDGVLGYHEDVVTYEVRETVDGEDRLVAVFMADNYARPNKQGGAWMSELRTQEGSVVPIVANNNNFARGSPTLLSWDDAITLFHEFGHGLHGMLSSSTYKGLAGTSVLRDFVELPSQLFEHWLSEPRVLKRHALHVVTGEPIPDALLAKLKAARSFGQGFATVEYTACALVDQALHKLSARDLEGFDLAAFETAELGRLGMPQGIIMRHRPTHFSHLFASSSYAAAYYVYLWAEVLDADAFDAFTEAGSCFDKETAARVRKCIYAAGNTVEPGATFRAFRGRDPIVEPMLKKKGLLGEEVVA